MITKRKRQSTASAEFDESAHIDFERKPDKRCENCGGRATEYHDYGICGFLQYLSLLTVVNCMRTQLSRDVAQHMRQVVFGKRQYLFAKFYQSITRIRLIHSPGNITTRVSFITRPYIRMYLSFRYLFENIKYIKFGSSGRNGYPSITMSPGEDVVRFQVDDQAYVEVRIGIY